MRTKSIALLALASGVLALGVAGFSGIEGVGAPSLFTSATKQTSAIRLNAADFANGNFQKYGMNFIVGGTTVSNDIATISNGSFYINDVGGYSGDSKSDGGYRGDGFTAVKFYGATTEGAGFVVYGMKPRVGGVAYTQATYTSDNGVVSFDLSAETNGMNRRRVQFNTGAGSISFSYVELEYECVVATPSIEISGADAVNVGSQIELTATTTDIFDSDNATYEWVSSDTNKATVSGNGKTATVSGVAAADAVTITVRAKDGETLIASDTFDIRVVAEAAEEVEMDILKTTNWLGSGLFMHIKPNSVAGMTASALENLPRRAILEGSNLSFSLNDGNGDYGHGAQKADGDTVIYITASGAPASTDDFSVSFEFTDTVANKIYKATANFVGANLKYGVSIQTASRDVLVGDDLALTAVNNQGGENPTYAWNSSDDEVATVSNAGVVTGVADGQATITVTMTVGGKQYTDSVVINVSSSGLVGTAISTLDELKAFFDGSANNVDKSYYLANDIDCDGWEFNCGKAGTYTGTFNGNGKTISNFVCNQYIFYQNNGVIKDVSFDFTWGITGAGYGPLGREGDGFFQDIYLKEVVTQKFDGAASAICYMGSGSYTNITEDVYYAANAKIGALFAETAEGNATFSGTNTFTFYTHVNNTLSPGYGVRLADAFTRSNGGTYGA